MRYEGQGYETSVKLGSNARLYEPHAIRDAFEAEYRKIFGLTFPDYTIEIVQWTVEVAQNGVLSELRGYGYENVRARAERDKGSRSIVVDRGERERSVPVINRYALRAGDVIRGDALVEENDTTIYIPAAARAVVASSLDLLVDLEKQP